MKIKNEKICARDRDRTRDLQIHCPLPYPLLHGVGESKSMKKLNVCNCKGDKSVPPHAD